MFGSPSLPLLLLPPTTIGAAETGRVLETASVASVAALCTIIPDVWNGQDVRRIFGARGIYLVPGCGSAEQYQAHKTLGRHPARAWLPFMFACFQPLVPYRLIALLWRVVCRLVALLLFLEGDHSQLRRRDLHFVRKHCRNARL